MPPTHVFESSPHETLSPASRILGHKIHPHPSRLPRPVDPEAFPNPRPQRNYETNYLSGIHQCLPRDPQPDFATITITMFRSLCVEMKSLKLYYLAYRNKGFL